MAAAMQAQGQLPSSLTLWAAENPLRDTYERLQRKVPHKWRIVVGLAR